MFEEFNREIEKVLKMLFVIYVTIFIKKIFKIRKTFVKNNFNIKN